MSDPSSSTLPPSAPPPVRGSRPRLTRATDDSVIGGVCGGLARHLDVDPTMVRLVTVAAVLFGGIGVFVYLLAWAIIPTDRSVGQDPAGSPTIGGRGIGGANGAGVLLAGAGALLLLVKLDDVADAPVVPLLLIGLGAVLLWGRRDDPPDPPRRVEPPWSAGPPPPTTAAPGTTVPTTGTDAPPAAETPASILPAAPARWSAATDVDPTYQELDEPVWDAAAGQWVSGATSAPTKARTVNGDDGGTAPAWATRPPRRRARGVAVVLGGILAAIGASGLAVVLVGGASRFAVLAAVLIGAGVVIAAGSLWGGAKRLVPGALVVLAVMVATAVLDVPLGGGVGERTLVAAADATFSGEPRLSAGELVLDLRDVDVRPGTRLDPIEATVGFGALVVELPPGLDVEVVAHTSLGAITIDSDGDGDVDLGGVDLDHQQRFGPDASERPDLVLDLRVGIGEVEVIEHGE